MQVLYVQAIHTYIQMEPTEGDVGAGVGEGVYRGCGVGDGVIGEMADHIAENPE